VVIFTFKNLKFSELSKKRKLIHLSFIKIQKKVPFQKNHVPARNFTKDKKAQKHQKNDNHKMNPDTSNPINQKNHPGITLPALIYLIIFCL